MIPLLDRCLAAAPGVEDIVLERGAAQQRGLAAVDSSVRPFRYMTHASEMTHPSEQTPHDFAARA